LGIAAVALDSRLRPHPEPAKKIFLDTADIQRSTPPPSTARRSSMNGIATVSRVNNRYRQTLEAAGMVLSGQSPDGRLVT
jgi:hypothetical protein